MKMRRPKRLLAVLLAIMMVAELTVSVILGTFADTEPIAEKSVIKQLIDFSNTEVATGIADAKWPEGISKLDYEDYKYNSTFSVDIAEDNGDKFLKFNFDQSNNVNNNSNMTSRGRHHDIFLKVSVPYWYINYMQDFTLDMVYNYRKNTTGNQSKAFYILGLSDGGTVYSKSSDALHATIDKANNVQNITDTKVITDLGKYTDASADTFLGATQGLTTAPKWTREDFNKQTKIDIILMFSAPDILNATDKTAGYYMGIKGVSITLKGPEVEIDNIDNEDYVTPGVINFEEGTTLSEVVANNGVKFSHSADCELSDDAYAGNGAFLFKRRQDKPTGNDYDSNFGMHLQRNVTRSKGITFMAKNPLDKTVSIRIWIRVGNDTGANASKGKYQYIVSLPANMTEYQRVSIYWDNVGLMNFANGGEWWAGSSSGNAITADELASGISLNFKNYSALAVDDYGILFDEFEYITKQFTEARKTTLIDFSGAEVGSELPGNIKIGGAYEGSTEIVENIDGSKSLRLNYDAVAKTDYNMGYFESHHMRCRPHTSITISVPKGSMVDLSEVAIDMTNNRATTGVRNDAERIYTDAQWNFGVGDSVSGRFGKTAEINDHVNWVGNKVVTKKVVGMRYCSSGSMNSWVGNNGSWTKEELANIDTFVLYISAPDCDGTEGESFQINSITLMYNEPSQYNEEKAREIIHSEKAETLTSGMITAKTIAIGNQDANSAEFRTAIEVEVKDTANTEALTFKNTLFEYYRNALPFYNKDSAVFHMFAYSKVDSTFDIALVDKNGAELKTSVVIPAATTNLYKEVSVPLKEIYDAALANDANFTFDLTDIRAVKVLPVVSEPSTVKIAGVTVLSGPYLKSEDDPEKQKFVNLVNFDNCAVGSKGDNLELPSNVSIGGYGGSKEIVQNADGSKALQINLDQKILNTGGELHQTNKRTNIQVVVTVPVGSLKKINKVYFTITNNAYSLAEQTKTELKAPITMAVVGDNGFVKQGESASSLGAQKGESQTLGLQVKNGFAGNSSYYITSWMSPDTRIEYTQELEDAFETVRLYLAVPDIEGTNLKKGLNFQINSIDLEFEEAPIYDEQFTRAVFEGSVRDIKTTNKSTITSTYNKVASNNINYRTIKKFYEISAKEGNTAPVIVENSLSKFLRNGSKFIDTATFRLYYQTATKTKAQISLVNANGEKLPFEVDLAKSTSDKFDQVDVSFKEVYDAFIANGGTFSTNDITNVEILPLSDKAIKIKVASPTLWSKEAGSASSAGNYYKALDDDSIRVEAYNYNIADEFSTSIEKLDPETTIAANGTKIPAGAEVVGMFKITLRNANGEIADPTGRFWVSYKLPSDVNLERVAAYQMFFDGSLVKIKLQVMDANNYLSFEDFFANKTFAVLVLPEETPVAPEDEQPDYEYDNIPEGDLSGEGDVENIPSKETITVIKRRKKKAQVAEDFTWLIIVIVISAVVVLAVTGLIIFLIIFKKRKNRKENMTS